MYALTNQHGLRLAITAGRIGFAPAAASPPRDAIELALGFPLWVSAPMPSEVSGAVGPVIGLEVAGIETDDDGPTVGTTPVAIGAVVRAVFQKETHVTEWRAGLAPLGIAEPAFPLVADAGLFDAREVVVPAPGPEVSKLAERWRFGLDRQERVSAGLLLGDRLAANGTWERSLIERLRTPSRLHEDGDQDLAARVRRCASAFARLDAVAGWSKNDIVTALEAVSPMDLGGYATAYVASSDPFDDAPAIEASDAVDEAIAFLLDHQGASGPELAEAAMKEARSANPPLVGALVGLTLGRSLLPGRLREGSVDSLLVADELAVLTKPMSQLGLRLAREGALPHGAAPSLPRRSSSR